MNVSQISLPEGRTGQALAVGVPLAMLLVFSTLVLAPAFDWYQARDRQIMFQQQEITHITAMRKLVPTLRRQVTALQAASGNRVFLAGNMDAVAGANLQSALETLASQSNASLTSITILPVQQVNGLRQTMIDVTLTAPWPVLIDLLGAIDLAHPRMIVSDLNVTGAGQAQDGSQSANLQISFSVAGFRLGR